MLFGKMMLRFRIPLLILLGIVCLIFLFVIVVGGMLLFPADAEPRGYAWTADTQFSVSDHAVSVEMRDTSLRVMLLTDMHLIGVSDGRTGELVRAMAERLNPDLIVLLGDQCFTPFNLQAYGYLIALMDDVGIPWAPIYGNHDNFGDAQKNKLGSMLSESVSGLFQYGPQGMTGSGNYVLNIVKDAKSVHTFYLLDSHTTAISDNPPVTAEQALWYEWAVKGIRTQAGGDVPSTVMLHVPLPEFVPAWQEASDSGSVLYGEKREASCVPDKNTGLFDKMIELGSTKGVFSGHDHLNNFSVTYKGIRLSYSNMSGYGSYGADDMKGATLLTVNADGSTEQELVFYKK
ncbi:MAG: metallophosphoesterase [Clostridiales bacterium]|jgi:3',5'-cyclic AMP phosphodiesterase CpdA|nr:metallophosphoesterase [Clostridiales bacterium]